MDRQEIDKFLFVLFHVLISSLFKPFSGIFLFQFCIFLASFFRLQKAKRTFTIRFRHLLKTMHRYKLVYYVDVNFSTDKTEFYRVFFHLFIRVFHILFPYL